MHKAQAEQTITRRYGRRSILAAALSISIAAFGCTTNQNAANGQPTNALPAAGPKAPTAVSQGTTGNGDVPIAMISAQEEAAEVMKRRQAYAGRYLGPSNPGLAESGGNYRRSPIDVGLMMGPDLTTNATYGSIQVPGLADGGGAIVVGGGITAGAVAGTDTTASGIAGVADTTGATAAAAGGRVAAATGVSGGTVATYGTVPNPTGTSPAAGGLTAGATGTVGTTVTPTVTATTATGAISSIGGATGGVTRFGSTTASPATVTTGRFGARATRLGATASGSGEVSNPVRIVTSADGSVLVTNDK